jgi:gluconate 5-dehydrogenase
MTEMSAKDFRQVIDVDFNAPFIVANAFIQSMIMKGGGKIICICSMLHRPGLYRP